MWKKTQLFNELKRASLNHLFYCFSLVVGRKYICIFPTECNFGTSGFNCEDKCDTCNNSTCERIDGNCTNGCIGGYSGYQCQLRGMSMLDHSVKPSFPVYASS